MGKKIYLDVAIIYRDILIEIPHYAHLDSLNSERAKL